MYIIISFCDKYSLITTLLSDFYLTNILYTGKNFNYDYLGQSIQEWTK